jgi:hypothetical protein
LLADKGVQAFVGTDEYLQHKVRRFSKEDFDIPIHKNEAFLLSDSDLRKKFQQRYEITKALYYKGQPAFADVLSRIGEYAAKL